MANNDNPNGFSFRKNGQGGTTPLILTGIVATSQTIAKGDAIILASGLIQIAVATSGQLYGIANESIVSSAAGATMTFIPAAPGYIFSGQGSGTPTQAMLGTAVDIEGATGVMEINENAVVEKVIQLVGVDPDVENALGANARMLFTVARSQYTGREDAEA